MNIQKQELENLIQSIYPAYNPHIPIHEQLGNICIYLFVNDEQNINIQKFRSECLFFHEHKFWHYYLSTRLSMEDIAIVENMIWLSDDFSETILWDKSGHEIDAIFRSNYVIQQVESTDPEAGLFWIYFESEVQANSFIERVNQFLQSKQNIFGDCYEYLFLNI